MASKFEKIKSAISKGKYDKARKLGGKWDDVDLMPQLIEYGINLQDTKKKTRFGTFFYEIGAISTAFAMIETVSSKEVAELLLKLRLKATEAELRYAINQKILELPEKMLPNKGQQIYYLMVYQDMNEQNLLSAINNLSLIINKFPEDVQAYRLRANLYRALDREDLAKEDDVQFTQLGGEKLRSKKQFKKYYRPAHTWLFLARLNFVLLFVGVGFGTAIVIALYRVLNSVLSGDANVIKKTIKLLQFAPNILFNVIISTFYWIPAELIYERRFIKRQWQNWQLGINCIDVSGRPIRKWHFGMNLSDKTRSNVNGVIEAWNLINDLMG